MPADKFDLVADGFATPKEAAKFLSISPASVYRLMDAKEIPSANFGRSRRIPRKALEQFAAAKVK